MEKQEEKVRETAQELIDNARSLNVSVSFLRGEMQENIINHVELKKSIEDIEKHISNLKHDIERLDNARHSLMIAHSIKKL